MTHVEKIARHVCVRLGYEPDLEVSAYVGQYWAVGPLGHATIPQLRRKAWELYVPIVREVLNQLRQADVAHAIDNEHADPSCSPESLWRAGVDALLIEEMEPFACDREDRNFGLENPDVPDERKPWKVRRGLE